ncbi:hypothetical protein DSM112329_00606 [Paraconexibacter sp. AEG42_29]|uniref:AB hydrolase-1 domain-containing protein n=1 Tax=Paraconexibacter sp. AEG42_29 TaxID=2997339 RepID=A0AAU7AQL2_9ACTN
MDLNHKRTGSGPPLLLIHGLAGSRGSFDPIIDELAQHREVIAIDLPGFGDTPPLPGEATIPAYADAVTGFIEAQGLRGVDVVGSSMGARLAVELARRGGGVVGKVVALDPGGFWGTGTKRFFKGSVGASIALVNLIRPLLPFLTGNPVTRTLLLIQFSARPWALQRDTVLPELRGFTAPSTKSAFRNLTAVPQEGAPAGTLSTPVLLVWGKQDRVTPPGQSARALELFPDAELKLIDKCGHFPHWDQPRQTIDLILANTG